MTSDNLMHALRAVFDKSVREAPRQHPLLTSQCPSLPRFAEAMPDKWTSEEREHIKGCEYCKNMSAMWRRSKQEEIDESLVGLGYLGKLVLQNDPVRPPSLLRQLRELDERFYPQAAGAKVSEQIAASVIGGEEELSWSSAQFAGSPERATLHGLGAAASLVRSGTVRFESGLVRIDSMAFALEDNWAFFCLADDADLGESNRLEVFALRRATLPPDITDPYDLLEGGHVLAAMNQALQAGWSGPRLDGLRLVAAGRMAVLVDAALDQAQRRQLLAGHEYVLEIFRQQSKDLIDGTMLAINERLRR